MKMKSAMPSWKFVLEQAEVEDSQWRIVHFQMQMNGRVFFRTKSFDTVEDETGFTSVPVGTGYAEAIRQLIRKLIEREGAEEILSDDQIVVELKKRDILIARRTVAKYRESLGIASSVDRRRAKALRG